MPTPATSATQGRRTLPSVDSLLADRSLDVNPENDPRVLMAGNPTGQEKTGVPREIRRDARQVAIWTNEHYQHMLAQREYLERLWIRAESYMEGFHYFRMNKLGHWVPVPRKEGEIRSTVPMLRSIYRRELGRFTENVLAVQAFPRSPTNPLGFFKAKRAEAMVNAWQEEIDFADSFTEWSSQMLYYSMSGLYRYVDPTRRQVFTEAWPAWELFPIPWNAQRDSQLQGVQRVALMTREWLDQNLGPDAAALAGRHTHAGPRVGTAPIGNSVGSSFTKRSEDAALVKWVWLLPTKDIPSGQHYILVEDQMFGYQATDMQGNPITGELSQGKLPIEFGRYSQQQGNWYGISCLCSALGAQAEADRQWSKIVRRSRLANGLMFINDEVVDMSEVHADESNFIRINGGAYGSQMKFFDVVPPAPTSTDVGVSLNLSQELGRMAVGHDSDLIFGRAEGRVESGPLGRILNTNSQAPIAPVFSKIRRSLQNTYEGVLDMLSKVWPEDKRISTVGVYDMPSELVVSAQDRPSSKDVFVRPAPLMASGRQEMLNILFAMRQAIGDDKKPMITDGEFRRGLASLGLNPPGLSMVSEKEERIKARVAALFGDGQRPGDFFTDELDAKLLRAEDPVALMEALKSRVLDTGFRAAASKDVKKSFYQVMEYIRKTMLDPAGRGRLDENLDGEATTARRMEETLDAIEQDPSTFDGLMQSEGIPLGIL